MKKLKKTPEEIQIRDGFGEIKKVKVVDYIIAKTLDLCESGYTSLTEEAVAVQLNNIVNGEPLSVIGAFMESDIVLL